MFRVAREPERVREIKENQGRKFPSACHRNTGMLGFASPLMI